ncbi:MAG: DUF882 domain-containing protein [Clostridia bacterium]|nr:DUF882 domain-containing protein [Clostridia bacterium]
MVFSKKQDGSKYLSKNFQVKEFACKDGSDEILIDPELVVILQNIRDHFGKAVIINSAYRSPAYNKKIGGATNSNHTKGMAADIRISGVSPKEIAAYAESIGVRGIGLYETSSDGYFVHVDTRANKSYWYGQGQKYRSTFGGSFNKNPYKEDVLFNITNCPTVIKKGSAFTVTGSVVATSALNSASCVIINAQGSVVQRVSINTMGKFAEINLSFKNLPVGEYTVRIDVDGGICTKWTRNFYVEGASSNVTVTCNMPTSIKVKKSCNITGSIKVSSGIIASTKACIINKSGNVVQSVSYTPYKSSSLNIAKCALNYNLKFAQLSTGTYTLRITATDNKGNITIWSQQFTVK